MRISLPDLYLLILLLVHSLFNKVLLFDLANKKSYRNFIGRILWQNCCTQNNLPINWNAEKVKLFPGNWWLYQCTVVIWIKYMCIPLSNNLCWIRMSDHIDNVNKRASNQQQMIEKWIIFHDFSTWTWVLTTLTAKF